jgi:hypothetical protein
MAPSLAFKSCVTITINGMGDKDELESFCVENEGEWKHLCLQIVSSSAVQSPVQWSEYECGHNIAVKMFYGVVKISPKFYFLHPCQQANINISPWQFGAFWCIPNSHFREQVKEDNKIMSNHNHPSSSFAMQKFHSSANIYF